jgi:hypothetical protein
MIGTGSPEDFFASEWQRLKLCATVTNKTRPQGQRPFADPARALQLISAVFAPEVRDNAAIIGRYCAQG